MGMLGDIEIQIPELDASQNHEYHITVDYETQLFQIVAYYWRYLGWQRNAIGSTSSQAGALDGENSSDHHNS